MPHVGRTTTALILGGAVSVVLVGSVLLRRPLLRTWYEWRFASETTLEDRQRIAVHLARLGGEETITLWLRVRFEEGGEAARVSVGEDALALGMRSLADGLFLAALDADSLERQEAAVAWLQSHGNTETAGRLLTRLRSLIEQAPAPIEESLPHQEAVSNAFVAIARIAERETIAAIPLLLDIIEAPTTRPGEQYQARICATHILASLGPDARTVVPRLQSLLSDDDELFRATLKQAIRSLGHR